MDRRNFFKMAAAGAFGTMLDYDPERFLWIPGAKKIFIPPRNIEVVDAYSWDTISSFIRALNEATMHYVYGSDPWVESVIERARAAKHPNPFTFYYNNIDWEEREI